MMIKELFKFKYTYLDFYNRYKYKEYCIHKPTICKRFKINNNQLRKMVDSSFLKSHIVKKKKLGMVKYKRYLYRCTKLF